MGQFHSTFYSFGRASDLQASSFQRHFLDYDPAEWAEEGSGSLQFFSCDDQVISLVILQNEQYGIMLAYDCYDKVINQTYQDFYSVGDIEQIDKIEDVGDEEFFPVGSFLRPEQAWLAVEDFFIDPIRPSGRIEWIASDQIKWPAD